MPAGRPTEYNDKILKEAEIYLATCEDTHEVKQRPVVRDGKVYDEPYVLHQVKIPTIEGLAVHLGISRETVYDWENKYSQFSDIIGRLRAEQAQNLINKGLSGDYNPTIAKVLLSKHGYREGIEQTGKDGKDLIPDAETKEKGDKVIKSILGKWKK